MSKSSTPKMNSSVNDDSPPSKSAADPSLLVVPFPSIASVALRESPSPANSLKFCVDTPNPCLFSRNSSTVNVPDVDLRSTTTRVVRQSLRSLVVVVFIASSRRFRFASRTHMSPRAGTSVCNTGVGPSIPATPPTSSSSSVGTTIVQLLPLRACIGRTVTRVGVGD